MARRRRARAFLRARHARAGVDPVRRAQSGFTLVEVVVAMVLVASIMQTVQSEVYRIPFNVSHKAMAQASLGILAATFASGFSVIRRLDRLDLIAVLKVHE